MERPEDWLPPEYRSIIDRISQVNEALAPTVAEALSDAGELPSRENVQAAESPADDKTAPEETPTEDNPE